RAPIVQGLTSSLKLTPLMAFGDVFEHLQQALFEQPRIAHFEHLAPVGAFAQRAMLKTIEIVQGVSRNSFENAPVLRPPGNSQHFTINFLFDRDDIPGNGFGVTWFKKETIDCFNKPTSRIDWILVLTDQELSRIILIK